MSTNETVRNDPEKSSIAHLPSDFESYFGPRIGSQRSFAEALSTRDKLSDAGLECLHRASAGRIDIAQALVDAAHGAGIRTGDIDQSQVEALLPPSLTPRVSEGGEQNQAAYLLTLFSWLPRVTASTVSLVHDAYRAAEATTTVPATSSELLSRLVAEGLLAIESGEAGALSVPALIRPLMRRITGPWTEEFRRGPREAFRVAIENRYARAKASVEAGYDEILDLVVEIEDWDLLEQLWTRRSINVFDDVAKAVDAFLSVPEAVVTAKPILGLARSAARRIDSMRNILGTEDTKRLVPATDFDTVVVPNLHGLLSADGGGAGNADAGGDAGRDGDGGAGGNAGGGALTADEVAALTTAEARYHRANCDYSAGLATIDSGRRLLRRHRDEGRGPAAMMQAGLNLEHGKNLVAAGRFAEALNVLQRVVQFSETYAPNSWHPMLDGYVETALASLGHGHGKEMGRSLALAREKARSFGMDALPSEHKWQCLDAMRSLDRLDLTAAEAALEQLRSTRRVTGLGSLITIVESIYHVYSGRASIAAKELIDNADTRQSPMTSVSNTRFPGLMNISSFVFSAAGATKSIQELESRLKTTHPGYSLVKARQSLVLGQGRQLWSYTARILSGTDGPSLKGCAAALRAAFLHHDGREAEAVDSFGHVLDYCIIASTLMPIAQMSKSSRTALVEATSDSRAWTDLVATFDDPSLSVAEVQRRLLELPETLRVSASRDVELSSAELSLLVAIDSKKSLPQIADEFDVVSGTLKNRLSALYKKFGVRSRAEVLEYTKRNGYLPSAESPEGESAPATLT